MAIWRIPRRVMKPFAYLRIIHRNNSVEIKVSILAGKINLNINRVVNRKTFAALYFECCEIIAEKIEYRVVPKHWEDCRPNWGEVLVHLKVEEVTKLQAPELFTGKLKDQAYRYVSLETEPC